ncbi:MAG: outer membrane beta-barrel protein [Chromatiales bacterium]|nr:outer membrane beta-barrel protein [Chromatiales bacterium]
MSRTKSRIIGLALAAALPSAALAEISFYAGIGGGGSRIERDDINLDFKVVTDNAPVFVDPPFTTGDGPFDADPFIRVDNFNGTDFAWKLFAGARFGPNLGVEAGYINLGEAEYAVEYIVPAMTRTLGTTNQDWRPQQDRQVDVKTKIEGFQLYGVGFLPLNDQIELFGKIGLLFWDRSTVIFDQRLAEEPVDQPFLPDIQLYTGGRNPDGTPATDFIRGGPDQNLFACFPANTTEGGGGVRPIAPECNSLLPSRSDSGTDLALGFGLQIKASERVALRSEFEWFDIKGSDTTWAATVSIVFGF